MFVSADKALKWAFMMSTIDIVKMSGMNRMCGKQTMGTRNELLIGLDQQEARQQAANIISVVYRLSDPVCVEYLLARHGRRFEEQDIGRLIERVMFMLGGGTFNRRAVRKLVLCYFGCKINRAEIRAEAGVCDNNLITEYRRKIYDALDAIGDRAIAEVENMLKRASVVA